MELIKTGNNIFRLHFRTAREMCEVLMRFQEFYESPQLKGQVFTRGWCLSNYSKVHGGNTYSSDWGGMNFPSYVLDPFIKGLFDPLTKEEQDVVEMFRYKTDKFYVLGTNSDSRPETIKHEVAHGLFYSNDKYKVEVEKAMKPYYPTKVKAVLGKIKDLGYHESVHFDEVHAYVCTDIGYLKMKGIDFPMDLHKKLKAIFDKYTKDIDFGE